MSHVVPFTQPETHKPPRCHGRTDAASHHLTGRVTKDHPTGSGRKERS